MKAIMIIFMITCFLVSLQAQEKLLGKVMEPSEYGTKQPLTGANIFWLGTTIGTTSDLNGKFRIECSAENRTLIVSFIGYDSDTLQINDHSKFIEIVLIKDSFETGEVEVVAKQKATFVDYLRVENSSIITQRELKKAACCDLSESFETNPSVDVSLTDAITGTKQIEMLGLSGIYTQTSMESLPFLRGLIANVGLTFVPGTWIQSINVSKGIGSVVNGYESITGQIDIGLAKPFHERQERMNLNIYGNNDQRFEANLNYRLGFGDKLSSVTLFHASSRQHEFDMNNDSFMDMPRSKTFNIMQRWKYANGEGFESQIGFQYVNDKKNGGNQGDFVSANPSAKYLFSLNQENINIYGKAGYVFLDSDYRSFGFQWSLSKYKNSSRFGNRLYTGDEKSGYFNFIYQSAFGSSSHKFRTGMSFLFDEYHESFNNNFYSRIEKIPGIFFEYTYSPDPTFSVVAGARADFHNEYDFMFTPRFHLRYAPNEDWVFRAVAGRGYRTSNIFVEYSPVFSSSRTVNINATNSYGYGLDQESAWNYGLNITHYFLYNWREATISIDLYRTQFENLIIADLDSNPGEVNFSSVEKGAFSNSAQVELNLELFENFHTRLAYRYLEVQNKINNVWKDKILTAKNRALFNLSYSTDNSAFSGMAYDLTLQWFGSKRLPSTESNPEEYRARSNSPDFLIVNAQITKTFFEGFELYIGAENLLDFRQNNPIIDPFNPNSEYFDASLVWGPVSGRMIYAGFRYNL